MLTTGTKIGPYEVVSALGAGGMGEVYRARDTKLDREVALKILPEAFAADPDRLARFEREAKSLAALNHPHIAQIHGLEDASGAAAGGIRALIMELVEGPTLADRIEQGPVPFDEAIGMARQIAEALEAAHDAGIIHRDLKPANIKLRPDGVVKVLDFGLAKGIASSSTGSRDFSPAVLNSPTLSIAATQAGVILGTAAYMSPEQVRGRRVDQRVDVWAFGCVLFEMLAGQPPFRGDSVNDLMAAVISEEPEWSALPSTVPAPVKHVIRRCLRKDPRQRIHSIADARLDLEESLTQPAVALTAVAAPASRVLTLLPWAIALVAVVALGVLSWRALSTTTQGAEIVRFSVNPPSGTDTPVTSWPLAALSPDGKRLVMAYDTGGVNKLFVRPLGEFAATLLQGTEGSYSPFFSADGNWVGFTANRKLKKVSIDGRSVVDLCDADWGGGTWGSNDEIVFTPTYNAGLARVPAGGGTPQKLTEPDASRNELGHWWPQFLPDGKFLIFTAFTTPYEKSRVELYSIETGQRSTLVEGAMHGRYAATGHLLFARGETVMAVRFDPSTHQVSGQPVPVIDNVSTTSTNGLAQFAVSPTGTLTFVPSTSNQVGHRLVWLDRKGNSELAATAARSYALPQLSPDGRRVAMAIEQQGDSDIWIYDLVRGTFARVTSEQSNQLFPVWSTDGRTVFYVNEQPLYQIYRRAADLSTPAERVLAADGDVVPTGTTADGKYLIYQRTTPTTSQDLWAMPLAGGEPTLLVQTPSPETLGVVSPDGRWLAYLSGEGGRPELYVQPFMRSGTRTQLSANGANQPAWSSDSKELFFVEAGKKLMSISIAAGQELSAGTPRQIIEGRFDFGYHVAADGRFIVAQRDPSAPPVPVNVVLNWTEELKQRVPR